MLAHLDALLYDDAIGEPLANCFDLAREAGASTQGIVDVYNGVITEMPSTLGGRLVRDGLLNFCFANVARLTADLTFISREDVEQAKLGHQRAFATLEEIVADAMDSLMYIALVRLHAATVHFLIETGRPLPRMLFVPFCGAAVDAARGTSAL